MFLVLHPTTMYSASIVHNGPVVCFGDVHEIGPPFIIKTYPVGDFRSEWTFQASIDQGAGGRIGVA
jgi:hypothetical protein